MMMIRNEQRAYKNMGTEKGAYNTTCTMHNEYYTKQLTQSFKPRSFPPRSIQSNTDSSNT